MKKILLALIIFLALFEIASKVNEVRAHGPSKTLYFRRCNYNPGVRWQVRYQVIFSDNSKSGYIYGTTGPESAHNDYYAEEVCNGFANRTGASEPLVNTGSNAADPPHPGGFISSRLGPRQDSTKIVWSTACVDPVIDAITVYETLDGGHFIWEFVEDVSFRRNINGCNVPNSGCSGFNAGNLISAVEGKGTINFSETSKCSNNPPPPKYKISGHVFIDKNEDGDKDPGEPYYNSGDRSIEKWGDYHEYEDGGSNNNGFYEFFNLPGRDDYGIKFNVPSGYRCTTGSGCSHGCQSQGCGNGITLGPSKTYNFGIALDRGAISGVVYIDEWNGNNPPNGKIDGNDTRRRDELVRMDPNGANETRRTDRDGRYRFGDLNPGSDHNIRLDGIEPCRLNVMGDNPKINVNAPSGGNNDVHFRLTRRYFEIVGNIYRYDAAECTPTINTNCQAYGRSVKLTAVGTGRNDDSKAGDAPDYKITRIQDQNGAYSVRLTGLRDGESVVGGNEKDVIVNCANARQDFYIRPAGATEFDISGTVYVDSNNDGALQKATDEIYDGGGTVQIRTGNNSASTGRTGPVRNNGTYTVIDNPQNTNYTVRLQQGTLASGYTVLNNDRRISMGTADVAQVNFLVDAPANTYSIRGGVYIDSDNPEGKKTGSEPYVSATGSERIRIQGLPAGANCPQNRSSFVRDINNFTGEFIASGIQPGCYRVEFNGPSGRGANWRVTYPSGISPFTIGPIIVGPNCNDDATDQDGIALCATGAGGGVNGNITNVDFGIKQQDDNPWYQSVGGDVRIDEDNYRNIIPDGNSPVCTNSTYPYVSSNSISGNLTSGVVFTGSNPNFSDTGNDRSKASNRGWLLTGNEFSPSRPGTIRTSYTYMNNIIEKGRITVNPMFGNSATKTCINNSGPDCTFRANLLNGVYKSTTSVTIRGSGNPETYTFPDGRDYVFLIEDDLRIESNIQVNPGSTVTFIVSGDIIISPDVTELDGIYSADGSFITQGIATGANDQPLRIEGNVIANAGLNAGEKFDQRRDLGDAQNVDCPAVTIVSRPDFILNGPELIRYTNYVIQEIAPGADRSSQGAGGFLIADTYTPPFTPVPNTPTPRPPTPEPEEPTNTPRPSPRPSQEPEEDNFPFFCQYGAVNKNGWVPESDRHSWDYTYDGGKRCDIYGSGCAMTSLAMIMKYFGDNMNPESTSRQATNNKYPINLGCQSPGTLTSQLTNTVVPWLRNRNYSVPGGDRPNQVQFTFDSQGDYTGKINLKVLKVYIDHGYLLLGGAKITMATKQGLSEPAGHAFVITDINVENETMTAYDPTFCQKDYPNLQGGKRTIRNVNKIGGNPIGCSNGDCGWVQMFAIKKKPN